jgi:monovalent cation:H+ antiporter-2, CPA2 family
LQIVLLLAIGFTFAGILGYFAVRLKLSPILGYLLSGYLIGPYSPGFVADLQISEQLAEIGVILMMFGVGLHFKLHDLIRVKTIAIFGAIGQILVATLVSAFVALSFGWSLDAGIILGLAIGVASTVVLIKMLGENQLLKTREGHIAIGWLIVEDIITVLILLILPAIATVVHGAEFSFRDLFVPLAIVLGKFISLVIILLAFSQTIVSYILSKVIRTRSHELFTISILALIFLIATGATFFFGISIALGAFIAGMVIRQTRAHQKALAHSQPMKDAFIAIFFLSVGMLFNPAVIMNKFPLFISILAIILLVKPLTAFLISVTLKYPFKVAITVAAALSQIGEFSFILSEESIRLGFMTDDAYDIIVACALISIAINPLIFKFFHKKSLRSGETS